MKEQKELRSKYERLGSLYPVVQEDLSGYLKSTSFKKALGQIYSRSINFEQGLIIAYGQDRKIRYVWDKEVGLNFSRPDFDKLIREEWIPLMWIQAHPINEGVGDFQEYVPSEEDIVKPQTQWPIGEEDYLGINTVGGLIVPARRPTIWVWQTPNLTLEQLKDIYAVWDNSRPHDYLSYSDIDTLVQDLKFNGINIHTEEVDRGSVPNAFSHTVKQLDVKLGFLI